MFFAELEENWVKNVTARAVIHKYVDLQEMEIHFY